MHVRRLSLFRLQLPLRATMEHAAASRDHTDNLVCEVELDDGTIGHGEGVPRGLVTGESFDDAWDELVGIAPAVFTLTADDLPSALALASRVTALVVDQAPIVRNASRAAIEIALLDAFSRSTRTSLRDALAARVAPTNVPACETRYSLVLGRKQLRDTPTLERLRDELAYTHIKVKVGFGHEEDLANVHRVREVFGAAADVRADANRAWTLEQAVRTMHALCALGVTLVEDPIAGDSLIELAPLHEALHRRTGARVILDETVRTADEARVAAQHEAGAFVSLRVSKCGGMLRTIDIANAALNGGIELQIGCQVGESAILSAAARQVGTALGVVRYWEGSNERFKFTPEHYVCAQDLTYGRGGLAPSLDGPGLGIDVLRDRIAAFATRRVDLT